MNVIPDPVKAPLIRKAFQLYAAGNYPFHEVRRRINELGFTSNNDRTLSTSNYQWMLKNPFYYGLMEFNGEVHEGKYQPIISKRLFDEVQAVMMRKSKAKTPDLKPYTYRGLFRCGECGCFITTETQKGHNYLRCTKRVGPCTQKYVREDIVSTQIDAFIAQVALDAPLADQGHESPPKRA
jgi:site-specific DNA recombinase